MIRFYSASAEMQMRAQNLGNEAPDDQSTDDQKARARAIIEAQLAKKRGGGDAHGPRHDREGKAGKAKGQFAAPPTRPGQRGRRG
jgi:hypothetical protein